MSIETVVAVIIMASPILAVWALLEVARRIERWREAAIWRQIALTDAIHAELGAVVAPEVRRTSADEWIVSVRVPMNREAIVSAVVRITRDLFHRLDRESPARLRVVLRPQDQRRAHVVIPATRVFGRLNRAA
jgi:hypothetical protein